MPLIFRQTAATAACVLLALALGACDSSGGGGRAVSGAGSRTAAATAQANAIPRPTADHATTTSGSSVRIAVLGNDQDPDGDTLRIALVGRPQSGSAELDNNGTPDVASDDTVVYVAPPGFAGTDQFFYTVADEQDARATAAVTVTVDRVSRTVLRDDEAMVERNQAVTIAIVRNDSLAVSAVAPLTLSSPAHGSVVVDTSGTPLDVSDDVVTYTPDSNYVGPDSFVYAIGNAARASVSVTVGSGPNATGTEICGAAVKGPLAGALIRLYAADASGAALEPALAQALTDSDGRWCTRVPTARRPLVVTSSGGAFDNEADTAAGQPIGFDIDEGLETLLPAGERYAALTLYSSALLHRVRRDAGSDDVFDLFAQRRALFTDALGFDPLTTVPADPSAPARDAPEVSRRYALALGGIANTLNTAATRLGLAAPGYALVDALVRDLSDCIIDGLDAGAGLSVDVDGAALAMPDGLNLALETLRFRNNRADLYSDSNGTATNLAACQAPAAAAAPVSDQTPPVFTALPAPLTLTVNGGGAVAISDATVVTWLAAASADDNRSGALVVSNNAPPVLPLGTTVVAFTATDAAGNITTNESVITVTENQAPTVTGVIANRFVTQGAAVSISLAGHFADPEGEPLSFAISGLPAGTTLSINPTSGVLAGTPGVADAAASPLLLSVTASDGSLANNATFSLIVTSVNTPPTIAAQAGVLSVPEDTPLVLSTAALTIDDPDDSTFALSVQPGTNYAVTGTTITPAANFSGLLRIPVSVDDGEASSATFDLEVTVVAVNDAPVITGQSLPLATAEDTPLTVTAGSFVIDDPDSSVFTLSVLPGASYTASGATVTPAADFNGTLTVPIVVSDGDMTSAAFSVSVPVSAVNDAPTIVAQANALVTDEDTALVLDINDVTVSDPDSGAFTLRVLAGANYTVSATTVTPVTDFNGTLTVPVVVSDGDADSSAFDLTVAVTAIDDAPAFTAVPTPLPVLVDGTFSPLTVSIRDIDTVAGALSLTATSSDQALLPDGNISIAGTGLSRTLMLVPAAGEAGSTTVSLTLSDATTEVFASVDVHVFTPGEDRDGDGLTDFDEGTVHLSDWNLADTDGDNVRDGAEVAAGGDPLTASARVTYVDPAGSGADGLSWATAYQTLQQASADILTGGVPGDPRYVLMGNTLAQTPGQAWSLDLGGATCDQIALLGSLAPGQTLPQLDFDGAPTTRLDVQGYDGAALVVDGCRDLLVFDVQLSGGDGDLAGNAIGGGVHVSNAANATFTDVWITGNSANDMGGGLAVSGAGSLATLRNVLVASNVVFSGDGGGVYVGAGGELVVEDSTIRSNYSGNAGGGFFVASGGMLTLYDSLVRSNVALTVGAQYGGGGGAVLGGLLADRSIFADNRQTRSGAQPGGGALYLGNDRPVDVLHSMILGNLSQADGGALILQRTTATVTLRNNLIAGNASLTGFGGGIHAVALNSGQPVLIASNTIAYNHAVNGAGGFDNGGGIDVWDSVDDLTIRDNVIWFNDDEVNGVQTDDNVFVHGAPTVSIASNNIEDSSFSGAAANIDAAPLFEQGFRLDQATSPSLNAGSQGAAAAGLGAPFTTDVGGSGDVGVLDQGYHYSEPSAGVSDAAILSGETAGCLFGTVDLVFVPTIGGVDAGPGRVVQVVLGAGHTAGGTLVSRTALRPYGVANSVLALDRGNGEYRIQVGGADYNPGNRVQIEVRVDSPTAAPQVIDSSELDPLFAAAGC